VPLWLSANCFAIVLIAVVLVTQASVEAFYKSHMLGFPLWLRVHSPVLAVLLVTLANMTIIAGLYIIQRWWIVGLWTAFACTVLAVEVTVFSTITWMLARGMRGTVKSDMSPRPGAGGTSSETAPLRRDDSKRTSIFGVAFTRTCTHPMP